MNNEAGGLCAEIYLGKFCKLPLLLIIVSKKITFDYLCEKI